jgi:hypothetical protein
MRKERKNQTTDQKVSGLNPDRVTKALRYREGFFAFRSEVSLLTKTSANSLFYRK